MGDVIRTLPAVKALKASSPSSSLTWMVEEPSKALLESQPEIDQVILFPRRRWTEGIKSIRKMPKTIREIGRFILDLRRQEFDMVLDFHGILKSGLLSFFSGSPKRIGFDRRSSKEGNSFFSNVKVRLPDEKLSRFQRNFELLQRMGLEVNPLRNSSSVRVDTDGALNPARRVESPTGIILKFNSAAEQGSIISNGVKNFDFKLHIPPEDREYVKSFFHSLSNPLKKPFIAVHPGTSPKTLYKRWMPDQYAKLADRLIHELNATVIFTWGPDEMGWVEGIRKEMQGESILGPQTKSLTELGEVLRRCDLYIGGDTGPMHIASLVGTPVVAIYGPTDPIINEPLGLHKKVIKEVGCNPCRKRSCRELTCLKAIMVDDVLQATKEILSITA